MRVTTILIKTQTGKVRLRWWGDLSKAALRRTLRSIVETDVLVDAKGERVAEPNDGDVLTAIQPWWWEADDDDPSFEGKVIKYERVLSHLANERTALAWFRAALTLAAQGIMLWQLDSRPLVAVTAFLYLFVVPIIVYLSLRRWLKTKRMLETKADVAEHFGKMHIHFQAGLLLVICIMAAATFALLQDDTILLQ